MKNASLLLVVGILALMILPMISADVIMPGYHPIGINNKIININEFPDYVFISVGEGPMCNMEVIKNGLISEQYKFCSISVYAISKEKFDEENLPVGKYGDIEDEEKVSNYLLDIGAKKVIEKIDTYQEVSDASTVKVINNFYTIDLNQVKVKPDEVKTTRNNLIYFYIIIPIIAILIISYILIRRRK